MLIKQKYLKALFWLLIVSVLVLSCVPGSAPAVLKIVNLDKVVHFSTFLLLSTIFLFAYTFSKLFIATALLMTLFGLLIEVVQLYIPNRLFSIYDLVADILGVLAALLVYMLIHKKLQIV